MSSALAGVKVREVTMTEVEPRNLNQFIQEISDDDNAEDDDAEYEEDGVSVMAGEQAG